MFKKQVLVKYQVMSQADIWFHGRIVDSEVLGKSYSKLDVLHFWHDAEGGEDGAYGTFEEWLEDVNPERLLPNKDSWLLEYIPTDKITEHHPNTQSQTQRAKEFISEGNLDKIPPIIIKRKGDCYETIDGATRLLAYKLANIPKIKALHPR